MKKIGMLCLMFALLVCVCPELPAYASNTTIPTPKSATSAPAQTTTTTTEPDWLEFQPIKIMKYLASFFLAYVSFKGAIQLSNNISELSVALKQNDDASKQNALNGIVGGALQFFISGLLAIFGVVI